jgi:hypothetical protein
MIDSDGVREPFACRFRASLAFLHLESACSAESDKKWRFLLSKIWIGKISIVATVCNVLEYILIPNA